MKEILSTLNICKNVDNFVDYYDVLVEYSKKFNITALTEKNDVAIKHFKDSLAGLGLLPDGARVIEIGSGGGFPSVPLKLENPTLNFTLCEATLKKCEFLKMLGNRFGFENFDVINARAEELGQNGAYREIYDFAVARAVAPLNVLLELLLPLVRVGGKVIAYKGQNYNDELESAKNAMRLLGGKVSDLINYDLGDGQGARCLVVIEKVKSTPALYPRAYNKIKKHPL